MLRRITNMLLLFRPAEERPIPIYMPLRRCNPERETLLDDLLAPDTGTVPAVVRSRMPKRFIERAITRGNALVLLDGLDEVADPRSYSAAVRKIAEFVRGYERTKVVVTCRKAGWSGGGLDDFRFMSTLPLDQRQQSEFVRKWYVSVRQILEYEQTSEELERRARLKSTRLIELLRIKERLRDIASNPLILSLICLVHRRRRNLPRGRAELYEECLHILLEVWDRDDKDLDQEFPSYEQKRQLLQRIAQRMHTEKIREIDRRDLEKLVLEFLPEVGGPDEAKALVSQIEVRSGIITERSINRMAFAHLTLQEYLVSEYFGMQEENLFVELNNIDDWAAWREPLLLMFGDRRISKRLLQVLAQRRPPLAISGIAETDPAHLDKTLAGELVRQFIAEMHEDAGLLQDGIPPLVGLLGLEEDPFESVVEEFILALVQTGSRLQFQTLIDALCGSASVENARMLLTLVATEGGRKMKEAVYTSIGRIGDVAIREAQEWRVRGALDTQLLLRNSRGNPDTKRRNSPLATLRTRPAKQ